MDKSLLRKLLVQSQNGDKRAYEKFLLQVLPEIQKRVSYRVFFKEDVSEVVQEALLSLHKSLATYDQSREVMPWVMAITERRVIDYIRKFSKKVPTEEVFKEVAVTNPASYSKTIIETGLMSFLPELTQKCIILTKLKGYSTKEAADILGLNENALRTRVSRGLAQIRTYLKKEGL